MSSGRTAPTDRMNVENYESLKGHLLKLISTHHHSSIVLYGDGGNGKSHLINEIRDTCAQDGYNVYHSPDNKAARDPMSIICTNVNPSKPSCESEYVTDDAEYTVNMNHLRFT